MTLSYPLALIAWIFAVFTGISIAPVPNQRYYDTIYQERYMGLPKDNVDGYRDGSAINFARNLKGDLLLNQAIKGGPHIVGGH